MNNWFTTESGLGYFECDDSWSEENESAEEMFREFVGDVLSDPSHGSVSGDEREGCESNKIVSANDSREQEAKGQIQPEDILVKRKHTFLK